MLTPAQLSDHNFTRALKAVRKATRRGTKRYAQDLHLDWQRTVGPLDRDQLFYIRHHAINTIVKRCPTHLCVSPGGSLRAIEHCRWSTPPQAIIRLQTKRPHWIGEHGEIYFADGSGDLSFSRKPWPYTADNAGRFWLTTSKGVRIAYTIVEDLRAVQATAPLC